MYYPEKIQKIIEELDSGRLTIKTEETIKRILMSTVEIHDTHYSNEHSIMERAMDDKSYSYEAREPHPDKRWTDPLKSSS